MPSDNLSAWERFKKWAFKPATIDAKDFQFAYTVLKKQPGTGALLDTREAGEKEKDVHFAEIVAGAAAVNWVYKAPSAWRKFPIFNQNGTGACVAFTMAKILGILRWLQDGVFVVFSMGDIYTRRTTAGDGMNSTDPFSIAAQGVTLDALMSSQNLSEEQINALKRTNVAAEVAALFKLAGSTSIVAPAGDIESIASIIQVTGKPVMIWFYFTAAEWSIANGVAGDYNIPKVLTPGLQLTDPATLKHSITAVDYTLDENGVKCLVAEDSAWFGGYNRRLLTQAELSARNWFAAYPMNFAHITTAVEKPKLTGFTPFNDIMQFIPWDSAANQPADTVLHATQMQNVIKLQKILQILTDPQGKSYFPLNIQCTGYYGAATASAVYRWQTDNKVVAQGILDNLQGKSFGSNSVAFINVQINSNQ